MPVPPHPHRRAAGCGCGSFVYAAGRGGCHLERRGSRRALRRASSCTTLAGRGTSLRTRGDPYEVEVHLRLLSVVEGRLAAPSSQRAPRAKSEISCGVAVSKPTTSSIPGSFGSAIEKPFETMPTTTSRASMPDAWR